MSPTKRRELPEDELIEIGHIVPLIDVLDQLNTLFETDREAGNNILQKLMPSDTGKDEFLLFIVCWKMAKIGKKPREIF